MKMDFRKKLENLLQKNEDSPLALYVKQCLETYDRSNSSQENPYGVTLQKTPEPEQSGPIAAKMGNNTTSGWSNPFGGTSWGV